MMNRIRIVVLFGGLLLTVLLAVTNSDATFEVIKVRIIIEKGSVWNNDKGKQLIKEEIVEARRIWFADAGVKLHIPDRFTEVEGNPDAAITKDDIVKYAKTYGAKAEEIIVIFRNKSVRISRAWTEPELVKSNTPIIIVGKKVFDKAGTKRDLAHELGHVLLRDEQHTNGPKDLMNITWAPDNGDYVRPEQVEMAKKYPNN
jgi:hypothetical protein